MKVNYHLRRLGLSSRCCMVLIKATLLFCWCGFTMVTNAFAENKIALEGLIGAAIPDQSNFSGGLAVDGSIALVSGGNVYRAGLLSLGKPDLKNTDVDAHVEINGAYIGYGRTIETTAVNFELGAGILIFQSDAYFAGRKVAEEDGNSPYVEIRVIKSLTDLFSLQAGLKYINDVSGSNFYVAQTGVRFSF